jgi:lysophospholipase L1-like esterase
MTREATSPQGTDVHFETPAPTGGREPYTVQCNPGSSSVFAIGETTVTCTATDADMAQASCGFAVTVSVSQTIAKTTFMAFGDSITAGAVSLAPLVMLDGPETYPFKLEQMLRERYPSQSFLVTNRGEGGESTRKGLLRVPGELEKYKPEIMLLLEGVNASWLLSTSEQASNLRGMVVAAQERGANVIIATVMPVTAAWEVDGHVGANARIRALNPRIFQIAAERNIGPVVDLYALFDANMHLIGKDGIHPTPEGQTRIAEAFRDEIVRRYDNRSTMSFGLSTMRRAR